MDPPVVSPSDPTPRRVLGGGWVALACAFLLAVSLRGWVPGDPEVTDAAASRSRLADASDRAGGPLAARDTLASMPSADPGPAPRAYTVRARLTDESGASLETDLDLWSLTTSEGEQHLGAGARVLRGRPGDRVEVRSVTVDGQTAIPAHGPIELDTSGELVLSATLASDGAVRVLDARTRTELPRAIAVLAGRGEAHAGRPPTARLARARGAPAPSPVSMPAAPGRATYWIGSPGYAWRRITYGGSEGGVPSYALERGGALRVSARLPRVSSTAFLLRLSLPAAKDPALDAIVEEPLVDGESLLLDGLPGGPIRAQVVVRAGETPEFVASEAAATIVAGEERALALDLDETRAFPGFGELVVRLDIGGATDLEAYVLRARRTASVPSGDVAWPVSAMLRGEGTEVTWRSSELLGGRWRVAIEPFGAAGEVDVVPHQTAVLALALAPAPRLRLWCLDSIEGSSLRPSRVHWRPAEPGAPGVWREAPPLWDGQASTLRTSAGRVEIVVLVDGFADVKETVDVAPEWTERSLTFERAGSIPLRLDFRCEGAELPLPADDWARLRVFDARGESALRSVSLTDGPGDAGCCRESAGGVLMLDRPGAYELVIEPIPGFRAPARVPVEVSREGATLTLEFERDPPPR